ncbi:hypothetical protein ATB53_14125 [Xanthomonas translucens]|uniref:Uncharacterized protein n=1 Tax=Xanthomonas campestris pv. translucens TaxID=343 RepID=A0A109HL98_XANCT|nr:hypothetical protein ATB53_14125 [Xanthomonas translucens]
MINELHDDDATAAGDTGEGVEIVATAGESLSGSKIHLYNGSPRPPRQRRRLCHHRGAGRQPGQLSRISGAPTAARRVPQAPRVALSDPQALAPH